MNVAEDQIELSTAMLIFKGYSDKALLVSRDAQPVRKMRHHRWRDAMLTDMHLCWDERESVSANSASRLEISGMRGARWCGQTSRKNGKTQACVCGSPASPNFKLPELLAAQDIISLDQKCFSLQSARPGSKVDLQPGASYENQPIDNSS